MIDFGAVLVARGILKLLLRTLKNDSVDPVAVVIDALEKVNRVEDEAIAERAVRPMNVDINYVLHLRDELLRINRVALDEIRLFDGDAPVEIAESVIDHWGLTGLSNVDFITSGAYRDEEEA